jgi:ABC-type transport system involved in cytochrome bd biosynthesis fused ATPase/permease subunit
LQLLFLIASGLIENLGYLFVGPILANYLGLISLNATLNKLFGPGIAWDEILRSPFLMPVLLLFMYGFRAIHIIQLQQMCRLRVTHLMERLRIAVYNLIKSDNHVSSGTISKYILSDLSTSVYSHYYHKLVICSCVIPFVIMVSYCVYVLGISASLVLLVWLLILFYLVSRLIKKSGKIGIDLNENNVQRYDQTSEFISISRIAVVNRIFNARWDSLLNLNKRFADNQYKLQVTSSSPKLLVEVFLIFGILILFYFYKFQGKSESDFIAVITLSSASLYRLMPLGINLVTSFMQVRSSREQHKSLEHLLSKDSETKSYLEITGDAQVDILNLFVKDRLGSTSKTFSVKIKENGIYGFVGKSGSGKSTLSDVISGLLKPTSGNVKIHSDHFDTDGNLVIGRSFQEPAIIKGDLKENIQFFREAITVDSEKIDYIGLSYLNTDRKLGKDQAGASLSGGEGKRIDVLRTLAGNTKLLIFDEPEAGLDLNSKMKMITLLKEASVNRTILVFSHDDDVIAACKEVFSLNT